MLDKLVAMQGKPVSLRKPKRNVKLTNAIMELALKIKQCDELLMETVAKRKAYKEALAILEANNK